MGTRCSRVKTRNGDPANARLRPFPIRGGGRYNRPAMPDGDVPVHIRSFTPADQSACDRLYWEGLIGGSLSENDTGADLDDIQSCYIRPGNHFWVAEASGTG